VETARLLGLLKPRQGGLKEGTGGEAETSKVACSEKIPWNSSRSQGKKRQWLTFPRKGQVGRGAPLLPARG